jgi:hypothetical protein
MPPRRSDPVGSDDAAKYQTGDSDRGAHGRAQGAGKENQADDVLKAIERAAEAGDAGKRIRAQKGFQRVSCADAERYEKRRAGPDVGDDCARRNRRPETIPENQERGERDSRGRPDERRESVDGLNREPEPREQGIDRGQKNRLDQISQCAGLQ